MSRPKWTNIPVYFIASKVPFALFEEVHSKCSQTSKRRYNPKAAVDEVGGAHHTWVKHKTSKHNASVLKCKREQMSVHVIYMDCEFWQNEQFKTLWFFNMSFADLQHPMYASENSRQMPAMPGSCYSRI